MRTTRTLAALAAVALTLAACAGPGPTEARQPAAAPHHDESPPDTITKCNGMIGSGTRC